MELLDGLDAQDPAARRSRRDLQRIHRLMGTRTILRRALCSHPASRRTRLHVLELGAGDGTLMLGVARLMHAHWPSVQLTLLDRLKLIETSTIASYQRIGWQVDGVSMDVFEWARTAERHWDIIVANLFLHHFSGAQLEVLLRAIATRSDAFFACEPRRSRLALFAGRLSGAIGANAVTRADSVASVRAGFRGRELARLWSEPATEWAVREYAAGLFSHCFHARRRDDLHAH